MQRWLALIILSLSTWAAAATEVQQLLQRGAYAEALTALEQQLRQKPGDAETRFLQGLALTMLQRNDEASRVFSRLARDYPELPEPANNLAVLQARQGDLEGAQDTLQRLIRRHPEYAAAHENLGDVLTSQAELAYKKASELGTTDPVLATKLRVLGQLSRLPGSRRDADTAVAPSPPVLTPTPRPTLIQPAPTALVTASQDLDHQQVLATLESWRQSWESGDVEAYLAYYASDFKPARGVALSTWREQRRARVIPERRARIQLAPTQIKTLADGVVQVDIQQAYASENYSDQVRKRVVLRRGEAGWSIIRELVLL